jgi:hypothetical protein
MQPRAWGRVSALCACVLMTSLGASSQSSATREVAQSGTDAGNLLPVIAITDFERDKHCAVEVVNRLVTRDLLTDYLVSQNVQLDSRHRITVFFRFKQDMRKILPTLHRFWKFPRWLGGGRYASSFGRAQPGFELHIDLKDPSQTVDFDAYDNSDVDAHEPAGDIETIVLHAVDVMAHKAGAPEKPPCELLAALPAGSVATAAGGQE